MSGLRDDLAALGLEPGADRRAIDGAFKRLMKQHHPDLAGGDGARAAEIIRAYRALRPSAMSASQIEFLHRPRARSTRWVWVLFAAIVI
ncbi:J domain-containing protein, partial [Klebsiella pneumoniae]|nr:J domain-containing protein [Klebsiella pneumoniae]